MDESLLWMSKYWEYLCAIHIEVELHQLIRPAYRKQANSIEDNRSSTKSASFFLLYVAPRALNQPSLVDLSIQRESYSYPPRKTNNGTEEKDATIQE